MLRGQGLGGREGGGQVSCNSLGTSWGPYVLEGRLVEVMEK